MRKTGGTLLMILALTLTGCQATVRNYETLTFSDQPVLPDTVAADVTFFERGENFNLRRRRSLNFGYFYDKFLADELIKRMEKRGWKKVPAAKAEYVLNINYFERKLDPVFDTNSAMGAFNTLIGKGVLYALYQKNTRTPVVLGKIILDGDDPDLEVVNEVVPIIDKELQTKNAYQKHSWVCRNDSMFSLKRPQTVECYMDRVDPDAPAYKSESKTMQPFKTLLIPAPDGLF